MFRRKSVEELRQEEFERRCREATLEVINRTNGRGKPASSPNSIDGPLIQGGEITGAISGWPYETIQTSNGKYVNRLRSSLFYWGALASFIGGVVLLAHESMIGGFLVLTASPCLLLYPPIRFLFGGKDSVGAVVTTVVVEELVKRELVNSIEKSARRKRR